MGWLSSRLLPPQGKVCSGLALTGPSLAVPIPEADPRPGLRDPQNGPAGLGQVPSQKKMGQKSTDRVNAQVTARGPQSQGSQNDYFGMNCLKSFVD